MKTTSEPGASPNAAPNTAPNALAVYLHGRRIGVITRLADDRNIFAFDESYIEDAERPTLSLSFKTASGVPAAGAHAARAQVPPFFSNLLPEGRLRDYLAARAGVNPGREFFLLHALGGDLPGAVTVAPADAGDGGGFADGAESGVDDGGDSDNDCGALRFSLAGVQLKFSAVESIEGGLTIPAKGAGGGWIVKLPSAHHQAVPENEFVMMELARRIGVPTPKIRLIPVRDIGGLPSGAGDISAAALAVERFDRTPDGGRAHIEDFAQIFGLTPAMKYEKRSYANIARVLRAEAGEGAVEDFVRRLTFSVLTGNGDMHLKNWSLIYRNKRTPELAPAYDFLSTLPYIADDKLALTFGADKDIRAVTQDRIRRFAAKADIPLVSTWRVVKDTAEQTLEAWKTHDAKDMLPDFVRDAVDRQINEAAALTLSAK
ncbi:MAG: type II toxin-antitoxin system HipA family toxin [Rhodospirillales bacterium]